MPRNGACRPELPPANRLKSGISPAWRAGPWPHAHRRETFRAHGQRPPTHTCRHSPPRSRPDPAGPAPCPRRSGSPKRTRAAVQLAARQRQRRALGLRLGNPSGALRQPRLRAHLWPPGQPGTGRLQRMARRHLPGRPGVRRTQPCPGAGQGHRRGPRIPHPQCRRRGALAQRQVLHQPAARGRPAGDHRRHRRGHHRKNSSKASCNAWPPPMC